MLINFSNVISVGIMPSQANEFFKFNFCWNYVEASMTWAKESFEEKLEDT